MHCIINRDTLRFDTPQGIIPVDKILSIQINHHWSYDELYVKLTDGSKKVVVLENGKILVTDNGRVSEYAFCKLDHIELGKTLI